MAAELPQKQFIIISGRDALPSKSDAQNELLTNMSQFFASRYAAVFPSFRLNFKDIETALFYDGKAETPAYFISYIMKQGGQSTPELKLINVSERKQMIDCGIKQMPFEHGAVISLSMQCKDGYEARMRTDGVAMPWLRNVVLPDEPNKKQKK